MRPVVRAIGERGRAKLNDGVRAWVQTGRLHVDSQGGLRRRAVWSGIGARGHEAGEHAVSVRHAQRGGPLVQLSICRRRHVVTSGRGRPAELALRSPTNMWYAGTRGRGALWADEPGLRGSPDPGQHLRKLEYVLAAFSCVAGGYPFFAVEVPSQPSSCLLRSAHDEIDAKA
jgi:hypothetical protein